MLQYNMATLRTVEKRDGEGTVGGLQKLLTHDRDISDAAGKAS